MTRASAFAMSSVRSSLLFVLVLCACGSESPQQEVIDDSERAWQRLERAHGDTYWYVDTGCGQGIRETSVVQVTDGDEVTVPSQEMEEGVRCEDGEPFRYGHRQREDLRRTASSAGGIDSRPPRHVQRADES